MTIASAKDDLPWVEKYRPNRIEEIYHHTDILNSLNRFIERNQLPHILLHGPAGTGKTTAALAIANELFVNDKNTSKRCDPAFVLELNASDDRGIDTIRDQIKTFASTRSFFSSENLPTKYTIRPIFRFKLIILDEVDSMTLTAQNALRRIMEKYVKSVRFILICNYVSSVIPAVQSRCIKFRFGPIPPNSIREKLENVAAKEGLSIQPEAYDAIINIVKDAGDLRRSINILQSACTSMDRTQTTIDAEAIYRTTSTLKPDCITNILDTLISGSLEHSTLAIEQCMTIYSAALSDIIKGLFETIIYSTKVSARQKMLILEELANAEERVNLGCTGPAQASSIAAIFSIAKSVV